MRLTPPFKADLIKFFVCRRYWLSRFVFLSGAIWYSGRQFAVDGRACLHWKVVAPADTGFHGC